ncbi:MAG: inositol 2-dehydrogenase [Actinobacteria bacterium]|nr:inositol 2-dehydrogenase [Actinomycetota bacterium]
MMHAELIAQRIEGAHLAGVYDVVADSAQKVAAKFGCKHFSDPESLMSSADVNAIAICTSTDTHVEVLIMASKYKKPVFCEKPISLSLTETDRALKAISDSNTPLMLGFNRRYDPTHRSVRDSVANGAIGDVHIARITSRDPAPPPVAYAKVSGGIFIDMTIHDFDSEIVSVYATGAVRVVPEFAEIGDLDTVAIMLQHANGAITMIDNSRQAVYGYDQRVEVFGSKGLVGSDNPLMTSTISRNESGTQLAKMPYFFLDRYIPSYIAEWNEFMNVATGKIQPVVTGTDGRASLVAGLAAWKSVREGRVVKTSEIVG